MTLPRTLLGLTLLLGLMGCSEAHSSGDAGNADAGELTLESCFAGIAPTGDAPWVGTQSFENEDGSIRVRLARQPGDRPSIGETFPYDMVRFGIERDGVVECITDLTALSYDFGHHNWNDTATAEGNATYVVTMRFDVAAEPAVWVDTLQINEAAPVTLRATACEATPLDLNHCLLRNMFP